MEMIDCGVVINTHGVRGEVKIKSQLDDGLLETLSELFIGGERFKLVSARVHKGHVLAALEGVSTIESAMALKNKSVTCERSSIPLPEGGYFYGDLYGFTVFDERVGHEIGTLKQVRESPAGMLYIVQSGESEVLIPAVDAFKRGIDFERKTVRVETIKGMLADEN